MVATVSAVSSASGATRYYEKDGYYAKDGRRLCLTGQGRKTAAKALFRSGRSVFRNHHGIKKGK